MISFDAGQLAPALKLHLEQTRPGLRVFLPAGDPRPELPECAPAPASALASSSGRPLASLLTGRVAPARRLERTIDASANFVLVISQDVLKSAGALGEVRHAARAKKTILLLHDESSCPFPSAGEIPEDLRGVFAGTAIPYPVQNKRKAASVETLLEACAAAIRR
eukprot:tig00020590_g11625.t1